MARTQTMGISIQRSPFSETSQVVHFLTPDQGRVACMVKGAFRDKNNYQGGVDLLVLSELTFTHQQGQSMALLRQRRVVDPFPGLRTRLLPFAGAGIVAELLRRGLEEGQRIAGLFSLTRDTLKALETEPVFSVLFPFQGRLLRLLGYDPTLDHCLDCEARPSPGLRLTAYPTRGGVVCRNCRAGNGEGISFGFDTAGFLMQSARGEQVLLPPGRSGVRVIHEGLAFYQAFFQHYLEKKLESYAFIRSQEGLF